MAFINWSQQLSVGINQIDAQHKKLVEMANELFDACQSGHADNVIQSIQDGLIEYTCSHFRSEELMMKVHQYPRMDEHKKIHDELTGQVSGIHKQFDNDKVEVVRFLKSWLCEHILKEDKQFAQFILEKTAVTSGSE